MRDKFETRTIYLRGKQQEETLLQLIPALPLDEEKPLQVIIREAVDERSLAQNKLMWAMINDVSDQVWLNRRKYLPDVWNIYFKQLFLPDYPEEGITRVNYCKWGKGMEGEQVLIGSTTDLTIKGMTKYLDEINRYASEYGVVFSHFEE